MSQNVHQRDESEASSYLREALSTLQVDHLALVIHDASFPGEADEDVGRGSPYSRGALGFVQFARALGFNALQLGPQGRTSDINPSPYDGTLFAKEPLSLALGEFTGTGGLLTEETFRALVENRPPGANVHDAYARGALERALTEMALRQSAQDTSDTALAEELESSCLDWAHWLEPTCLYLALTKEHGDGDWRRWPGLDGRLLWPSASERQQALERRAELKRRHADVFAREALAQCLLARQHRRFREELRKLDVLLFGDLQIGISFSDEWAYAGLFLSGYRMGAPPSRTNPEGQPWGYRVLDPRLYLRDDEESSARAFVRARMQRMLADFDGVRLDHPHGWICPWVYRDDLADAGAAVRSGARLFSSPDLPDHPALAPLALVTPDQLDRTQPRHADGWVRSLSEAQVDRYATLLSLIMEEATRAGRDRRRILCEVLSTWPYPLRQVMGRFGLGRFLVTQKANPENPLDVYRSETARPEDWIMLGTHDTESIWSLVPRWLGTPYGTARARHLAERLEPDAKARPARAEHFASSPEAMIEALFAELFASNARSVSVFFPDLLGMTERYNAPGTVGPENWSLRVPPDYRARYGERVRARRALSLPRALAMALHARGAAPELKRALERTARPPAVETGT